jgi:phosphoglycerate dehydrogenase-like enzyme
VLSHFALVLTIQALKRWPRRQEMQYRSPIGDTSAPYAYGSGGAYELRGRTAGMLGYGHIARETARILHALGVNVIAANTSGERRVDDGVSFQGQV